MVEDPLAVTPAVVPEVAVVPLPVVETETAGAVAGAELVEVVVVAAAGAAAKSKSGSEEMEDGTVVVLATFRPSFSSRNSSNSSPCLMEDTTDEIVSIHLMPPLGSFSESQGSPVTFRRSSEAMFTLVYGYMAQRF